MMWTYIEVVLLTIAATCVLGSVVIYIVLYPKDEPDKMLMMIRIAHARFVASTVNTIGIVLAFLCAAVVVVHVLF